MFTSLSNSHLFSFFYYFIKRKIQEDVAARRGSLLAFSQHVTIQFHAALEVDRRSERRRLSSKQKAKNGSTSRWKGFLILSEVQSDDPISEACVHRGDGIRRWWQEVADWREEGRLRSSQPWGGVQLGFVLLECAWIALRRFGASPLHSSHIHVVPRRWRHSYLSSLYGKGKALVYRVVPILRRCNPLTEAR